MPILFVKLQKPNKNENEFISVIVFHTTTFRYTVRLHFNGRTSEFDRNFEIFVCNVSTITREENEKSQWKDCSDPGSRRRNHWWLKIILVFFFDFFGLHDSRTAARTFNPVPSTSSRQSPTALSSNRRERHSTYVHDAHIACYKKQNKKKPNLKTDGGRRWLIVRDRGKTISSHRKSNIKRKSPYVRRDDCRPFHSHNYRLVYCRWLRTFYTISSCYTTYEVRIKLAYRTTMTVHNRLDEMARGKKKNKKPTVFNGVLFSLVSSRTNNTMR